MHAVYNHRVECREKCNFHRISCKHKERLRNKTHRRRDIIKLDNFIYFYP